MVCDGYWKGAFNNAFFFTRPSALGMSDPIMEFQGTPEQSENSLT